MIASLKGIIEEQEPDRIVLNCGAVGFEIYVPSTVMDKGAGVGEELKLYTYMAVREDSMTLYGFLSRDDLKIFKLLLGVNGIGPKAALGILSVLDGDRLRFAILTDDAAAIAKAPGVGKKTAQKLILELKDKFSPEDLLTPLKETDPVETSGEGVTDAVLALTALGYGRAEALKAVRKAQNEGTAQDTESLLSLALKYLYG